jgi:hypothetical protein
LPRILAEKLNISGSDISQWMKSYVNKGILTWCDKEGIEFPDEELLEKSKRSGKAYVRVSRPHSLPTPYQLTGDDRWNFDGEYYKDGSTDQ